VSKLLVVHDGKRERELLLVERLVVGRDPMCDFSHDDSLLSRRHAEFATVGDEVTVRDLGSRNGLFVNGARTAERALRPGDIVTIGPLRVRYVTSSAPFSLAPDELDTGSTRVIAATLPGSATLPKPVPAVTTPMVPVSPAPSGAGDAEEFEDDEEEVTRVVQVSDLSVGADAEPADDLDDAQATMMVSASSLAPETPVPAASPSRIPAPASSAPATLLIAAPPAAPRAAPDMIMREPAARAPQPAAALPVAAEPVVINASSLTGFVFVLLAALASVVFVASAAPLIMWRGDEAQAPSLANLLRWPVLPIIIAMATTYVVATLVNRRFLDMLMALQQDTDSGQDASPGGYPRG
jgi:hypothetical protein